MACPTRPGAGMGNTGTVSGIQIGGDAGAGLPSTTTCRTWRSGRAQRAFVVQRADLATRASTPLQVATPSAMWTPGRRHDRDRPRPGDAWLADFAGNGNGMAIATGSLSSAPTRPRGRSTRGHDRPPGRQEGKLALFGAMSPPRRERRIRRRTASPRSPPRRRSIATATPSRSARRPGSTHARHAIHRLPAQCGSVENVAISAAAPATPPRRRSRQQAGTGGSDSCWGRRR